MVGLPEAEGFALAGGAALVVMRVVDRATRDLDFFGPSADDVDELVNYDRAQTTYGIVPCDIDEDRVVQAWVSMVTNTLTAAPSTPRRRP